MLNNYQRKDEQKCSKGGKTFEHRLGYSIYKRLLFILCDTKEVEWFWVGKKKGTYSMAFEEPVSAPLLFAKLCYLLCFSQSYAACTHTFAYGLCLVLPRLTDLV
jgi:hypothetical protein